MSKTTFLSLFAVRARSTIDAYMLRRVAKQRRHRMMEVSRRVRDESMRVNAEFDAIEDAPDA